MEREKEKEGQMNVVGINSEVMQHHKQHVRDGEDRRESDVYQ